jgi:hypothetical protein
MRPEEQMGSLFTPRFNTNYVPSDEEIERIRADLVSHSQELARIDERICELSAARDRIKDYINSHRALISHPRRLPPDVVREIFVACLPTTTNTVMSVWEAPLVLCRICSAWRSIALSTPRLWASLHLPVNFVLNKKEQRMSAVTRWLQLSGACPVSFSVMEDHPAWGMQWDYADPDVIAFIKLLAEFSDRWCSVEFSHVSRAAMLGLAGIHTPMMNSLKITAEVSVLCQLDVFRAPSLHALALHAQGPEQLDEFVLDLPLFWDRLTHLHLDSSGPQSPSQGLSLYSVFVLLGRCPQLASFAFRANAALYRADSISRVISLPFLTSFILFEPGILEPSSVGHLMEHLSMPELRHLHVPTVPRRVVPTANFLVVIGTRSPLIETLVMNLRPFNKRSLLEGLRCFPSLTKLTAWGSPPVRQLEEEISAHPEDLLALLTPEGTTVTTVCPQLRDLRILESQKISKDVLVTFVQRRMGSAAAPHSLEVVFNESRNRPSLLEDEVQYFASRGFNLSLLANVSPWETVAWGEHIATTASTGLPTMNWTEAF